VFGTTRSRRSPEVKKISGGLSILKPITKGVWINPEGTEFEERMIPVRILCTREDIDRIIDFTLKYYEQEAVLAYKISNEVILRHASEVKKR